MATEKVHFTKEKETLLLTLYARALESRSNNPILADESAENLIHNIDYDFGKLKIRADDQITTAVRAKQLDMWTVEFLTNHPNATVLHLGCGLDSRVFRINPATSVSWYEVDYPEVIALRRRLYPERAGCHLIGSSVSDPDWLNAVPTNHVVWIVAEGLLMYLGETDVKQLLERLIQHFPSGQLAFDAFNSLGVRMAKQHQGLKETQASITWGIDDPHAIERWNHQLQFLTEFAFTDSPAMRKLPWWQHTAIQLTNRIPLVRRVHRLLRYRFEQRLTPR